MIKYLIVVIILFGSLTISESEKKNGISNRVYYRVESPLYRFIDKSRNTTVYWSRSSSSLDYSLDFQNLASK